jgi:hypothetical protein
MNPKSQERMAIKSESQYVVGDTIIAWKRNFKGSDYNFRYTASVAGLTIFIQTMKENERARTTWTENSGSAWGILGIFTMKC